MIKFNRIRIYKLF